MKIALAALVGITAGLTVAYFVLLRAPDPAQVCQHILDTTLAEAGDSGLSQDSRGALVERIKLNCIQHKKDKLQLRGRIEYATYARCVMKSATLRELEGC